MLVSLKSIKTQILIAGLVSCFFGGRLEASSLKPGDVENLLKRANEIRQEGNKPALVFDLDDTLFDTRYRSAQIFTECLRKLPTQYSTYTRKINQFEAQKIKYALKDTLAHYGIQAPAFERALFQCWQRSFFNNTHLQYDQPIQGAVSFVKLMHSHGIQIYYLTARPKQYMLSGTTTALQRNGFPINVDGAQLIIKEQAGQDDLDFKPMAINKILRHQVTLIAFFENEPRNLEAMLDLVPDSDGFWLKTLRKDPHSQMRPSYKATELEIFLEENTAEFCEKTFTKL